MKVTLYMAISVNGFVAKTDDDTSWVSKEEWESYSLAAKKAGNMVVGHRTYDILTAQPEFSELKNVRVVVLSKNTVETIAPNHFLAHSPDEALKLFADQDEVIIAGGGALNASFLRANLVDEIYVDIEPIIFGSGIPLFHGVEFEKNLKLLGTKQISDSEIQLHYQVLK